MHLASIIFSRLLLVRDIFDVSIVGIYVKYDALINR